MRARWVVVACLVLGGAVACAATLAGWNPVPGRNDDFIPLADIACLVGVLVAVVTGGIAFVMVVGARNDYTPRPWIGIVVALIALAATASVVYTLAVARGEDFWVGRAAYSGLDPATLTLTAAPWAALVGFAFVIAGGLGLWRFSRR